MQLKAILAVLLNSLAQSKPPLCVSPPPQSPPSLVVTALSYSSTHTYFPPVHTNIKIFEIHLMAKLAFQLQSLAQRKLFAPV